MMYAFDLDDTLANTKPLVLAAYASAGVINAELYWGLSAAQWMPIVVGADWLQVHERKTSIYASLLETCTAGSIELPAVRILRELISSNVETTVITSASVQSATIVLNALELSASVKVFSSIQPHDKPCLLDNLGSGVYVDDNKDVISLLSSAWRGVHVNGQSYDDLKTEILGVSWTP